jgi:hypothetical protein
MVSAQAFLRGPRGRRLLLELALQQERARGGLSGTGPLGGAVFDAATRIVAERGDAVAMFGPGAEVARARVVTPEQVAAALSAVFVPASGSAAMLLRALARSVDAARYWQEPDGEDVVAADPAVRRELERLAGWLAREPAAQWWDEGLARTDQWVHTWDDGRPSASDASRPVAAILRDDRRRTVSGEMRAARDRPLDPGANWSGNWWSCPPFALTRSARRDPDGIPVGLPLVEDRLDWSAAEVCRLDVPPELDVLDIRGADDWAALCRAHPLDVSAEKRHDWYRATGRAGRWVVPDWSAVALEHDAVHLTVAGYLAAAGTIVEVDDDAASVIAGWNPGETYWLTDGVRAVGAVERWGTRDGEQWEPSGP